jgi:hypothetical protein
LTTSNFCFRSIQQAQIVNVRIYSKRNTPNNLIALNKVKQNLQWYTEGVPKLQISPKDGVSRISVKTYIRQFIAMEKSLEEIF